MPSGQQSDNDLLAQRPSTLPIHRNALTMLELRRLGAGRRGSAFDPSSFDSAARP
jgi:hypothetical protein